jgi:hypothetical protein
LLGTAAFLELDEFNKPAPSPVIPPEPDEAPRENPSEVPEDSPPKEAC